MSASRVLVGMSGGVDSAVAALMLLDQGWAVEGVFMKNWEEDDTPGHCAAAEDFEDARKVCARLGVSLHAVNFSAEYWDKVFEVALAGYRTGRTPNPDILCNREIKFHQFLEYALSRGADRIATGHYARVGMQGAHFRLLKACDQQKDQTYFLYTLGQRELGRTLFPIGGLTKLQVRQLALQAGFPNHAKKDSTGICFVGERKFKEFLGRYIAREPGAIVTQQGEQIGCHDGLMFYTLGQRHGLRLGGRSGGSGEPWYVVGKDLGENRLVVAQGRNHPALLGRRLLAEHLFWVDDAPPAFPFRCQAKTRYRQQEQEAILEPAGDSNEGCCVVRFEMPQRAMTPGQSVVFYLGDECVGGGTIAAVVDEADLNNGESQIWRRLPR